MIRHDPQTDSYHLQTDRSSYILRMHLGRYPLHVHWGPRLEGTPAQLFEEAAPEPGGERPFFVQADADRPGSELEALRHEWPVSGTGDFRTPAFEAFDADGYPVLEPWLEACRIEEGKPELEGLPSLQAEATGPRGSEERRIETLVVTLRDEASGLRIELFYTVFPHYDALTRHAVFTNESERVVRIERAASIALDFPANTAMDVVTLPGHWGRERQLQRMSVPQGLYSIGSTRGTSSHRFNPFCALADPDTTERHGQAWGASLVYSGNHRFEIERSQDDGVRIVAGIHPETFTWRLEPGERFTTPEAVLVYSDEGLGGVSQRYHRLFREHLGSSAWRDAERPVLLNNWEATYFDFDERTILEVARSGAELGVELFVLDDGWFGERNADDRSLGDWWVNRNKLPSGISGLAEQIHGLGMRFGLWVEPEMVSPESELYRSRPQWALEIPGRRQALGRRQLVLDLTREEVQRYLIDTLLGILDGAPIDYIKWDMNRYLTHAASPSLPPERRGETAHRYVLGLYRVLDAVTAHAPGVLFEGCSGGGGRFDPGILAYMPQYWTSDNTDAVARLGIQEGTSLVYPPVTMGAHVSAVPNHQTGRTTGIETRGAVAMAGNLGYELDPRSLGAADREAVAEQIGFYRRYRGLIQYGRFHRLELGGTGGAGARAWLFTGAESGSGPTGPASGSGPAEALLFWIPGMVEANRPRPRIRIPGLDPDRSYVVRDLYPASAWPSVSAACGAAPQSGAELSRRGLVLPKPTKDFDALVLYLGS